MKKTMKILSAIVLMTLVVPSAKAQSVWGKSYSSTNVIYEGKGALNPFNNSFITTGKIQGMGGTQEAFLLQTNQAGNITWQTAIGDNIFFWEGRAVKTTSSGDYIVVGRTTKGQDSSGLRDSFCNIVQPYHNAFIAHITPGLPFINWSHVFGDSALNDDAIEVIEDLQGNFVVVGSTGGKLSGDTCAFTDSCVFNTYPVYSDTCYFIDSCCYGDSCFIGDSICLPGDTCCITDTICFRDTSYVTDTICYRVRLPQSYHDYSSVLVAKFDSSGNVVFNRKYQEYGMYDRGVSIIDDDSTNSYKVLVNRRGSPQSNRYFPMIMDIDYNGNPINFMNYDQYYSLDRIPTELVAFNGTLIVTGYLNDTARNPYTSFFIAVDPVQLNSLSYAEIGHDYLNLINKDMIVDSNDLVISCDVWQFDKSPQWSSIDMYKVTYSPLNQFQMVSLISGANISHNVMYATEKNTSLCQYNDIDTMGVPVSGYHLFGERGVHFKIDAIGQGMCSSYDSISLVNLSIVEMPSGLNVSTLSIFSSATLRAPSIVEVERCDTIVIPFAPRRMARVEEHSEDRVAVYPNPANNKLYISPLDSKISSISMLNSQGILMNTMLIEGSNEVDLKNVSDGLYYIIIGLENGTVQTTKIIVIH